MDLFDQLAVVVDTNCFIERSDFVKRFIELLADNSPKTYVLLPFVVLKELDGLKKSLTHNVRLNAVTSHNFLFEFLQNSNRHLKGQSITEIVQTHDSNDDQILDCCVFAMKSGKSVVLLSNDKNLCIKAMIHSITTISYFRGNPMNLIHQLNSMFFNIPQPTLLDDDDTDENMGLTEPLDLEMLPIDEFHDTLQSISNLIIECLSISFQEIYTKEYGPSWQTIVTIPMPWNLSDIMKMIKTEIRFTLSAISDQLSQNLPSLIISAADIDRSLRQSKSMTTKGDLFKFLCLVEPLFSIPEIAGFPDDKIKALKYLNELKEKLQRL
ncbi:PIN domain-containing protein [Globomyces pollinis-pini]|nr:PIN domain-containing protein [Globomyces pollinis-pini]